jgi:hypothetical protein
MGGPFRKSPGIKPRVSVDNLTFISPRAELYHRTLQAVQDDLYMLFCEDLWQEPRVATKKAAEVFVERFKGKSVYMIVPVDAKVAATLTNEFLVEADIETLILPNRI